MSVLENMLIEKRIQSLNSLTCYSAIVTYIVTASK